MYWAESASDTHVRFITRLLAKDSRCIDLIHQTALALTSRRLKDVPCRDEGDPM